MNCDFLYIFVQMHTHTHTHYLSLVSLFAKCFQVSHTLDLAASPMLVQNTLSGGYAATFNY